MNPTYGGASEHLAPLLLLGLMLSSNKMPAEAIKNLRT